MQTFIIPIIRLSVVKMPQVPYISMNIPKYEFPKVNMHSNKETPYYVKLPISER